MSLPQSHQKERLHSAYIRAVIAHAEQKLADAIEGDYGIDGTVRKIVIDSTGMRNKYTTNGHLFQFQLKATINCEHKNGHVVYRLDENAHLRFTNHLEDIFPAVLIVFDMPDDVSQCVSQDDKKLLMMGCCYWEIMDRKALQMKTVHIPSTQIFNADAIHHILGMYGQVVRKFRNAIPT